MLFQKDKGR